VALIALLSACSHSSPRAEVAPTTVAVLTTVAPTSTVAPTTSSVVSGPQTPFPFRSLDAAGIATYSALLKGDVQLAAVYSTQAALVDPTLVVLDDDKALQPAQNLLPIARTSAVGEPARAVLDSVSVKLTNAEMRTLNDLVERQGQKVEAVADQWLQTNVPTAVAKVAGSVRVATTDVAEQEIVGALYAGALRRAGATVTLKLALGPRDVVAAALRSGGIDLTAEYLGGFDAYLGGSPSGNPVATYNDLVTRAKPLGLVLGRVTPASDTDAIATTAAVAARYGLRSISDLAHVPDALVFGGSPQCPRLDTCLLGYQRVYGLKFVLPAA
jgi:glycine betaine/choline ABC-type transport system substrate-binding protein